MAANSFVYQPLADPGGQIRLVEVIAQQADKPLGLSLTIHSMADDVPFCAISYTWGDGTLMDKILINGCSLMVTKNCYYALTQVHARYPSCPGRPFYFWIDSICINQNDHHEKSYQVEMMGEIYTKASKVLACIGPQADNSQMLRKVLDGVQELSPQLYADRETLSFNAYGDITDGAISRIEEFIQEYLQDVTTSRQDYGVCFRKAFLAFVNRSYWSRIWIIQEIAATTKSGSQLEILCGPDSFSKSEVNLCFYIGGQMFNDMPRGTSAEVRYKFVKHSFQFVLGVHASTPIPAKKVLLYMEQSHFKCARPEDKVYGLLSLIKWPDGIAPIRPVYEPSPILDLAQLFTSITSDPDLNVWRVLESLEVYHDHELLRPLVEARMKSPPELLGRGKYPSMSFKMECDFLRIFENDEGRLAANLTGPYGDSPSNEVDKKVTILKGTCNGDDQVKLLFSGSDESRIAFSYSGAA
ncbi:Heterokaryon incompatibility protein 6, OR allele [Fusarium austroafricanum]|uniref:Heterokaryon incompatibility protein 6, OR allele n=1 Tax=Fusarium austroafricanum TaxID=2364996 RepID=A0A8H4NPM3_9HYPO|nr:Heterokaryon incompatibility protein 6, OR allele [Fusarium austroafricanum]